MKWGWAWAGPAVCSLKSSARQKDKQSPLVVSSRVTIPFHDLKVQLAASMSGSTDSSALSQQVSRSGASSTNAGWLLRTHWPCNQLINGARDFTLNFIERLTCVLKNNHWSQNGIINRLKPLGKIHETSEELSWDILTLRGFWDFGALISATCLEELLTSQGFDVMKLNLVGFDYSALNKLAGEKLPTESRKNTSCQSM